MMDVVGHFQSRRERVFRVTYYVTFCDQAPQLAKAVLAKARTASEYFILTVLRIINKECGSLKGLCNKRSD